MVWLHGEERQLLHGCVVRTYYEPHRCVVVKGYQLCTVKHERMACGLAENCEVVFGSGGYRLAISEKEKNVASYEFKL